MLGGQVDQAASVLATRGQVAFSLRGSSEKTLLGNRSDLGVSTVLGPYRLPALAVGQSVEIPAL